jgi:Peptidase A4 family/Putative Ig domain
MGGVLALGLLALAAGLTVTTATAPSAAAATVPLSLTAAHATSFAASDAQGYWLVAADGGIFTFGNAGFYGSTGSMKLNRPIVGMAATPQGHGYWLVAADGGIFNFGDAGFYGSAGALHLNQPIVAMAASPDGKGYWLVAADGGIFTFGDAGYYGSTGGMKLNQPIVGMAATPDGRGYWLVAADGGIFTFGDARYFGSTGGMNLHQPIVSMAATPDGRGYWLGAADGGIFTFGDAGYFGSAPAAGLNVGDIVALSPAANGLGYWLAGTNGAVDPFGGAVAEGGATGSPLNQPIVGFAATPIAIPSEESPAPLTVNVTPLPIAVQGVSYSAAVGATGGVPPSLWTLGSGSLPAGLSLSPSGIISGTPTHLGTTSFTVRVSDATTPTPLTASATLSITVAVAPLSITTTSLPEAIVGVGYSASLSAFGGTAPYSWSIVDGALPTGLTLYPSGGITGTPTGQGSSSFTVRALDAASPSPQSATVTLAIAVFPSTSSTSTTGSSNWSGYIELNGPFSYVTGTFSVPSLYAGTPPNDLMSEWVGIDGGNGDNSLIQAGFNESPDPNNPNDFFIQPWWEILPSAETYITTVQIRPGDEVTVTLYHFTGSEWAITLTDDTDGETFTTDQTYTGPASTAEWILEALTVGGTVTPLAPYAPVVTFSDLGFAGSATRLQEVVMVQSGNYVSTPSTIDANGFSVAYGPDAPPPP